jgi:hypothetical protein
MGVMRLYSKLILMIVLSVALQYYAPPSAWAGEAWFALRCHVAALTGDDALGAQMVDEYYREIHNFEADIQYNIEIEAHLAAAG